MWHLHERTNVHEGRLQLRQYELRRLLRGRRLSDLVEHGLRRQRRAMRYVLHESALRRAGQVRVRRPIVPERLLRLERSVPHVRDGDLRHRRRELHCVRERAHVQREWALRMHRELLCYGLLRGHAGPQRELRHERNVGRVRQRRQFLRGVCDGPALQWHALRV